MQIYDVINKIIKQKKLKSYVEIGFGRGIGFSLVYCENKITIDPNPKNPAPELIRLTSDDFFKSLDKNKKFDLFFIDGDHSKEQVKKDLENCLNHLSEKGVIVLHDISPDHIDKTSSTVSGDCWRAFLYFRKYEKNLKMFVVDNVNNFDPHGWGIVTKGQQECFEDDIEPYNVSWEYFDENRKRLMNYKNLTDILSEI